MTYERRKEIIPRRSQCIQQSRLSLQQYQQTPSPSMGFYWSGPEGDLAREFHASICDEVGKTTGRKFLLFRIQGQDQVRDFPRQQA